MQFVNITPNTTLSDLADIVGDRNVDSVLNANGLTRTVNIGNQLVTRASNIISTDYQTKIKVLNTLTADSDVYEKAALSNESDWGSLATYGTFSDYIKMPPELKIPLSEGILGNGEPVPSTILRRVKESLSKSHEVDPTIFNNYSSSAGSYGIASTSSSITNPFQWFKLPWGKVSLYSSISGEKIDFPVYPEELSDGVSASYDEMSDMLYQYEPWKVYKSSGPRENSYTFHMHRDMWTGNHADGCANDLIRACEANCYPEYNGSTVNAPKVTLYINGVNHITGILNSCKVDWGGPIGNDGFYLEVTLTLDITEISPKPLNYSTVRSKGLIE
jgi:hypothetical protein